MGQENKKSKNIHHPICKTLSICVTSFIIWDSNLHLNFLHSHSEVWVSTTLSCSFSLCRNYSHLHDCSLNCVNGTCQPITPRSIQEASLLLHQLSALIYHLLGKLWELWTNKTKTHKKTRLHIFTQNRKTFGLYESFIMCDSKSHLIYSLKRSLNLSEDAQFPSISWNNWK